jgi:hypothetical protein
MYDFRTTGLVDVDTAFQKLDPFSGERRDTYSIGSLRKD